MSVSIKSHVIVSLLLLFLLQSSCTLNVAVTDLNVKSDDASKTDPTSKNPSAPLSQADIVSSITVINISNVSAYALSGSCAYVSNLEIKVGSISLGTVSCSSGEAGAGGSWNLNSDLSLIADGNLNFSIYNASTGALIVTSSPVLKDTVRPVGALNSPPPAVNNLTSLVSAVSAMDTVEYSYKVGVAASLDCSVSTGYSSFVSVASDINSDLSALSDGSLRLCLVAKDQAGNIQSYSSASIYNWSKDTTVPTATLSSTPAALTNVASYSVVVGGTGITVYSYKFGVASSTDCSNASGYSSVTAVSTPVSGAISGGDNTYKLCVVGRNAAGTWQAYSSATSFSWVLDSTAPSLAISSPGAGSYISASNQSSYSVTSSCSENGVSLTIKAISSVNSAQVSAVGTCTGGALTVSLDLSSLVAGGVNLSSTQTDAAGNVGTASNVSVTKDVTAPSLTGTIADGTYFNSLTQSPTLSWSAATDVGGSGILKYQIAIGTSSGGTQVLTWTDVGNVTSYQVGSLSLTEGTTYYPTLRAVDNADNVSAVINGNGWIPDVTLPVVASVEDGDQIVSTSYSSLIVWPTGSDSGSGVASYEVRIVDNGNSQVTAWTNVGTVKSYGFTGLSLTEGQTYKAEVRAIDNAGNVGAAVQGNGWYVVPQGWKQQAYVKAVNADAGDSFGNAVAVDGDTMIIGANLEDSNQTAITNGTTASSNNSAGNSGAVYVYKRTGSTWAQEAYIKAANAGSSDYFGYSVALNEDTIVVGAIGESSNQTAITNGTTASANNSALAAGAVYVYKRTGSAWAQEAYIKAANAEAIDYFGYSVSISGDTLAVGALLEDSNQTAITNGTAASSDNSASSAGAVYVYKRTGSTWAQEAYIKAANAEAIDSFGISVSISGDTIAVGAPGEDSNQTAIANGATASSDNSAAVSGAVYVYKRTGSAWAQEAYIKAANADANDNFGNVVAIFEDTLAVGAYLEDSNQTAITNGTTASSDNSASSAGAVYVYKRTGSTWAQEAYIKAANADANDNFGFSLSISGDTVVVGATEESSNQTAITNGATASSDNSKASSGAVYVYKRTGSTWEQEAYIKAANADANDNYGFAVSISGDTVVVGAYGEDSNQTSIMNGTTASSDNSAAGAGAVYVYNLDKPSAWSQQAYVKSANAESWDFFGATLSISGDTLAVGAIGEDSNQTAITNGTTASSDNSASSAGAVYVYKRTGSTWAQEAYIKAANADAFDSFGATLSISGDTLAVGAYGESSNQTAITNGTTASSDNSASSAGAVYVYKRTGSTWAQEAYIKAANADANDIFGASVSISKDTLVVGAKAEDSNLIVITNGATASSDNTKGNSGAVYVYKRTGSTWAQEAYIKAVNADLNDNFGSSVGIYGDTIVVGAYSEDSNQTGITNGATASSDNTKASSGAVYVYKRTGSAWAQEAYIKAANADAADLFGSSVGIYGDTIVVGSYGESSNQTAITNGATASSDNTKASSGAVYVYKRTGSTWAQEAYIKAANTDMNDNFGGALAISENTLVVGSQAEASNQTSITNGTTASSDNSAGNAGAVYVYKRTGSTWAQEAYIKAANTVLGNYFGYAVGVSNGTVAVGAIGESSNQTSITNGATASSDNSASGAGAVYVYKK